MEPLDNKLAINPCLSCQSEMRIQTFKLISSGRRPPYPKYVPMIKETCATCGRYIRFVPQTDELINKINEKTQDIKI